jgi:phospholipase/carboxylesterase
MTDARNLLPCIEIETRPSPDSSVIWLHGLGADGHDFEPIVPELGLPRTLGIRFVFPHAPMRPVTVNGGMVMRAWYDIRMEGNTRAPDIGDLRESERAVGALIGRERERGVGAARIVLAGFSQGGALTLYAGPRHPERLAGLIAMSCSLPAPEAIAAEAAPAGRGMKVFMGHGSYDDLVPAERGRHASQTLTDQGYAVTWREYPIPHSVSAQEIADVSAFLQEVLK